MNIAMVSEHASPLAALGGVDAGGQNVHVAELAGMLVSLGHEVTVYTRRDAPGLARRVDMSSGVQVRHIDAGPPAVIPKDEIYPHLSELALNLHNVWRFERPDVVHSHFWMSGAASAAAARALDVPLVHTFHALGGEKQRQQGAADTSPPERLEEESRVARNADRLISTSSAESFELKRMGANGRAIKCIPCGVDLERFRPLRGVPERSGGRLRAVTLSRLVPRKGIDTAIEALQFAPNVDLVVAGGGAGPGAGGDRESARLQALARRLGVAERVEFLGRVTREAAATLLRSADVVVCTPWYEPFGIVPLEAMASGVPVIASAVGGLIDTVVDGVTGLHVPPREPRIWRAPSRRYTPTQAIGS